MTDEPELCSRCVLSDAVPGVTLRDGICSVCADGAGIEASRTRRAALAADMASVIEERRGRAEYDCVVAFSGGKDSSYTLMMLARDFGLKCLAITIDNGFISPQAVSNCKTVTAALGVDFLTYTPAFAFMRTMYVKSLADDGLHVKSAIRRASGICNSCIGLINTYMLKTAARQGIPIVAGGYVGGQVPQDAAILRLNLDRQRRQHMAGVERRIASFGADARHHFELGSFPAANADVVVINPMVTIAVTEDEIVAAIAALGWERTGDTGLHSSNCRLNDVGIWMHHRQHRFHPYAFEISEQIRVGLMTRDEGLRKVKGIPTATEVAVQLQQLDLAADQL